LFVCLFGFLLVFFLWGGMHAQNLVPVRDTFGQGLFRSRDFVTSGQKPH
jgi:hypothetical protein